MVHDVMLMRAEMSPLNQLNILLTRPQELANNLARLIEEEGGKALLYPVISIEDVNNPQSYLKIFNQLSTFDIAIFVSPTAVRKTFEKLDALPDSLEIAAIGSSTADALAQQGMTVSIKPDGHDSEALLKHTQLQSEIIQNKSIVIFRGIGGREHLAKCLRDRGAEVHYAEVYQRSCPKNIAPLTGKAINSINIITVTSNEGLQNLFDMNTLTDRLVQKPIVVPGARSKELAESLGFHTIIQAENATNVAYINALKHWASTNYKD